MEENGEALWQYDVTGEPQDVEKNTGRTTYHVQMPIGETEDRTGAHRRVSSRGSGDEERHDRQSASYQQQCLEQGEEKDVLQQRTLGGNSLTKMADDRREAGAHEQDEENDDENAERELDGHSAPGGGLTVEQLTANEGQFRTGQCEQELQSREAENREQDEARGHGQGTAGELDLASGSAEDNRAHGFHFAGVIDSDAKPEFHPDNEGALLTHTPSAETPEKSTSPRPPASSKSGLRLRFRTIASIVDCLPRLQDPAARRREAAAVAGEILDSLEHRAETLLCCYNTRSVAQMNKHARSGRAGSESAAWPRFEPSPEPIEEGASTMYGQWKLKEEAAAGVATEALRAVAQLAIDQIATSRISAQARGEDTKTMSPRLWKAQTDSEDPVRGPESTSAKGASSGWLPSEERMLGDRTDSRMTVDGDSAAATETRREEPRGDVTCKPDDKAAEEFDLWVGRDAKLCPQGMPGVGPRALLAPVEEARGGGTGTFLRDTGFTVPRHQGGQNPTQNRQDSSCTFANKADISAKAAAARAALTPALKHEKLWQIFGRNTDAGRLLHQLYASKIAAVGAADIVYPVPKSIKDLRGSPSFRIINPPTRKPGAGPGGVSSRARIAVPRVGRHPVTRTGISEGPDGGGCGSSAVSGRAVRGKRSLAKIAEGAERQRREILAEATAAAVRAATSCSGHSRTREHAKEVLQEAFYVGECMILPPEARLPAVTKTARAKVFETVVGTGQATEGHTGSEGRTAAKSTFSGKASERDGRHQTDPETGMTLEQRTLYAQTIREIQHRQERLQKLRESLPDEVLAAAAFHGTEGGTSLGKFTQNSHAKAGEALVAQLARSRRAKRKVQENLYQETKLEREIAERVRDLQTLTRLCEDQLRQRDGSTQD
ncbi:hypothetical protein BESB_019400 [Besnoitia besnoiti]|uniref:Glutamic acid-rich protein n=1 Tax=Besnoitia besnoiti TaxID=94643 RepID=A0A2A9M206_BESBE|nr:hypothetical protein BESB_019400 [Besnoitia besnoiti]PFH31999.1 hypothetical protein BESB_019400 [Besnoitia besnoiti]